MKDSHLDPPDYPEPPEWYSSLELALEDEDMPETVIAAIRKALAEWVEKYNESQDFEELHEPDYSERDWQNHYAVANPKCVHGNQHGNCDDCDFASDIAYDAAREQR